MSKDEADPQMKTGPLAFLAGGGETGALLRSLDWTKTPLGKPAAWPQTLKTLVQLLLTSRQAMFLCWGDRRTLIYNDAYAEFLANKHPAAMGRDFLTVWNEIAADLRPLVAKAFAGTPVYMDDITLMLERRGYREETHFSFSYTPVRDETGQVAGFFCPCEEITADVMERRQAALRADLIEKLRGMNDPDAVSRTASALLAGHFGADAVCFAEIAADGTSYLIRPHRHGRGAPSLRGRHPMNDLGAGLMDRLSAGSAFSAERLAQDDLAQDLSGPFAPYLGGTMLAAPVLEGDGLVFIMFVLSSQPRLFTPDEESLALQKADRVWPFLKNARTDKALREERAFLKSVIETAPIGISIARDPLDLPPILNEEARRMTRVQGWEGSEDRYMRFSALKADGTPYAIDDYPTIKALKGGARIEAEPMIYDQGGQRRRWLVNSRPIRDERGEIIAAVTAFVDVEDQRRTEEQVRLVAKELKHRVGNLFAVVQSLVALTAREEEDAGRLAETLRARIGALAAAHRVGMSEDDEDEITLAEMLAAILRPYDKTGTRLVAKGAAVTLPRRAVTPLGLILHELATNAVKYGAWSQEGGRLDIRWGEDESGTLLIDWQESCPDPDGCHEARLGSGFGTRLMRGAAAQLEGAVEQHWGDGGLRTRVKIRPERRTPTLPPEGGP